MSELNVMTKADLDDLWAKLKTLYVRGTTVGASNKPVYVNNGVATEVSSVGESFLSWGGEESVTQYLSPIDCALSPLLGNNMAAFIPASNVTIEYSTDGGTTWLDYGATDEEKTGLFTDRYKAFYIGKSNSASTDYSNHRLRITLNTEGEIYTSVNKFIFGINNGNASAGSYCTVERRTQADKESDTDTWVKLVDKGPVRNYHTAINVGAFSTYYSGSTKTTTGQIRFTFGVSSYNSSNGGVGVSFIGVYARHAISSTYIHNEMARTGHLYSYDASQNATFPAIVTTKGLRRAFTASDQAPALDIIGSYDNWIFRVSRGTAYATSAQRGFGLKYLGATSTSANNDLVLYADNGTGTQVEAIHIKQNGDITLTNVTATNIYGTTIYEGGSSLASKYLGISAQSTDSDKLDGQHGSYYATASSVTELQGYFTNGVANNALRLSNTSKIGDTNQPVYFTASGVPAAISYTLGAACEKAFDTTVTQNSSNLITSGAVWTAIDNLPEPMVMKGTLGTNGTIQSLPTASASNEGYTYKVITASTYDGQAAKVGDVFVSCKPDGASSYEWILIPAGDTDTDTWRSIYVNGTEKLTNVISSGKVDFVNGTNTTVSFNATGNKIQIDAVDTATAVDDILKGSNSGTAITYAPYTSRQDKLCLYTGTTAPNGETRLNLNGYLYATKLYSEGTEVSVSGHTHPYLPLAGGVMDNNVSIGWKNTSDVSVNNLVSYNTNNDFVLGYSQGTVGATKILGKSIVLYTNGSTARLTIDSSGTVTIPNQVVLSVAQGTAPLSVTSNTLVTNLNADLLDGQEGSYYAVKATSKGSTTKPIYTDANGAFQECSTYAGGTAVTLNETSKAASTASFYAPESAGTSGQVLTSSGGAPAWTDQSNITAGALTTTSKTAWGRTFWTANGVPDSISGNMTDVGNIEMNNNVAISMKDSNDADRKVMAMSASNGFYIGCYQTDYPTSFRGYGSNFNFYINNGTTNDVALTIDSNKNLITQNNICVQNNKTISFYNSASTPALVELIKFNDAATSVFKVGHGSYPTYLYGSNLYFVRGSTTKLTINANGFTLTDNVRLHNNKALQWANTNSNYLDVLKVNDSNKVLAGNANLSNELYATDFTFYIGSNAAATIDSNKNFTSQADIMAMRGVAAQGIADLSLTQASTLGLVAQIKIGNTEYDPTDGVVTLPAYPTASTLSGTVPISKGGTGMTTAEGARIALGISAMPTTTYTGTTYESGNGWCYDLWIPSSTTATFSVAYDPTYGGMGYVLIANTLGSDITVSFVGIESGQKIVSPASTLVVPAGKYVEVSYIVEEVNGEEVMVISWSSAMTKTTLA